MPVTVPCGQCVGCRLEYSRQWAMRCMHEASLHDENCMITQTYSDEFLPEKGSLDKSAFQKFMKRLRKEYDGKRIRYYHAGEYGDRFGRPHYHTLLFGHDFADKTHWVNRRGFPVYRSATLERLWPFGFSEIGSVTFESAAYVARYIMKKMNVTPQMYELDGIAPEYCTMSRDGGIGKEWYERYKDEVYSADSVIMRGREMKPPRFYDGLYEIDQPDRMVSVKGRRKRSVNEDDCTPERLDAKKACLEARVALRKERAL